MPLFANIAVAAVALLHVYILVLEMFLWTGPAGRKAFGLTPEFAEQTRGRGGSQRGDTGCQDARLRLGLYLGGEQGFLFKAFFLTCVLVAGMYGAATASRKILFVQALPAAIALTLLVLARLVRPPRPAAAG